MALLNPATLTASRNIANQSYVDLAWPSVANNGYRIYRADNGGAYNLVHTINATGGYGTQPYGTSTYGYPSSDLTSWQDTSTTIAGSYQYRIHVYDMTTSTEVTPGTLSGVIAALDVSWVVAGRRRYDLGVDVSWQEITGEDGYKIYRSENAGAFSLVHTAAANTSSWNDATANHLKVYQYKVRVYAGVNETNGTNSNTLNAEPCRSVTGITAVKNAADIDLSWTNTEQGDYCHIYRGVNGGPLLFLQDVPVASVTYTDSAVTIGAKYRYGVLQGTTTGGGVIAASNEESINARVEASWSRGAGTVNDEFFQLSRKLSEINATISTESIPLFIGGMNSRVVEYTPAIRAEQPWVEVDETLTTSLEDTAFNRAKFYVYGVRARDVRHNWSVRSVASLQV